MNEIKIFENAEFGSVRTVVVDDTPYFVGKDVAEILGYSNSRKAIGDHVDEEDKTDEVTIRDSIGRDQTPILINESGLYSLIISSKMPSAKKFKHWVTSEVLPSIRKYGAYMTDKTLEQALTNPDFLIRLATELKTEKEKRIALENKVTEDKPKVLFAEAVETAKTSILIGDLAKILKQNGVETGQKRFFEWLRNNGYLIKRGSSRNMPIYRLNYVRAFDRMLVRRHEKSLPTTFKNGEEVFKWWMGENVDQITGWEGCEMMKIENHCVGCPTEMGCLYEGCPHYRVKAYYCDKCKNDTPADYKYDGKHYCKDCLEKELDDEFSRLSVSEKIDMLALDDEIMEV